MDEAKETIGDGEGPAVQPSPYSCRRFRLLVTIGICAIVLSVVLFLGDPQSCRFIFMFQCYVLKRDYIVLPSGRFTGTWYTWRRNGRQASDINYGDGKLHGVARTWHSNGRLKSEAVYAQGKPTGTAVEWYDNGQKKIQRTYASAVSTSMYYTRTGKKSLLQSFKAGNRHGLSAMWDSNGKLILEKWYLDGREVEKNIFLESDTQEKLP